MSFQHTLSGLKSRNLESKRLREKVDVYLCRQCHIDGFDKVCKNSIVCRFTESKWDKKKIEDYIRRNEDLLKDVVAMEKVRHNWPLTCYIYFIC